MRPRSVTAEPKHTTTTYLKPLRAPSPCPKGNLSPGARRPKLPTGSALLTHAHASRWHAGEMPSPNLSRGNGVSSSALGDFKPPTLTTFPQRALRALFPSSLISSDLSRMPAENHSSVIYLAFYENGCPRTELLTRGAQHNTKHLPVLVFVQPLDFYGELQR